MNIRIKSIAVILGWAATIDAFTLWAIFQGILLPLNLTGGGLLSEVIAGNPFVLGIFYMGIFGTSILAAIVIADLGPTIISFFASYFLAAILIVIILALPDFAGTYRDPLGLVTNLSVNITFTAFFPLPFVVELCGTFLGIALAEWFE